VELIEMPRFFSSSIQSDVVADWFPARVTEPASLHRAAITATTFPSTWSCPRPDAR